MSCKKRDFVCFSLTVVSPEPRVKPGAQEWSSTFSALNSFRWGKSQGKKSIGIPNQIHLHQNAQTL